MAVFPRERNRWKHAFEPASPSPLSHSGQENSGKDREADEESESRHRRGDIDGAVAGRTMPPEFLVRLKTIPLFQDAPESFHTNLASRLKLMSYYPQEYIIRKGEPARSMCWILKGTVAVTSNDGESVYAELAPGSFFGEIGVLYNRPRTATVVARTKVLVGVLTRDSLNMVLRSYPVIERRIRDDAQERLAMLEKENKALANAHTNSGQSDPLMLAGRYAKTQPNGAPLSTRNHTSASFEGSFDSLSTSIQDFIKVLPIFRNLPSYIVHEIALNMDLLKYRQFEYIFNKGDSGSDIYFIVSGEVEVLDYDKFSPIGKPLARLKKGNYFGEMSFLALINDQENVKRSATIRSVSMVELVVVRSDKLKDLCSKYPFIVDDMKRTAKERTTSNSSRESTIRPSQRLSIEFLINENNDSTPSAPVSKETSGFFSPNYSLNSSYSMSRGDLSRSVSPVSSVETAAEGAGSDSLETNKSKRKYESDSIPNDTLKLSIPPAKSTQSSNSFYQPSPLSSGNFTYIPHHKRMRISGLYAGRRRSSLLVSTGRIPDSVLLKVFKFLTLPELMKARLVCKRWRDILYTAPSLFNNLDLTPWNKKIDDKALIAITNFVGSRPQKIDISSCFHVTDEGFSYLVNEVGISGNITSLKMRSNWEVSAMAIMDLSVSSVGGNLEEIDLSNCRNVRDHVIERLIGKNASYNDNYSDSQSHSDSIGCKKLRKLKLGYCKYLTDNVMHYLSLHANERLESLDLTRCTSITDRGFENWPYRPFKNLRELSLKDCTFLTDQAIMSIANSAYNLEVLSLNFCCALSDVSLEFLCYDCPKIRELDLSFCGSAVSYASLVVIALHLNNLEKLWLAGCIRATRAGIDALLTNSPSLKYLNISQCKNAHFYPGGIPAQKINADPKTKNAFIIAGSNKNVIEVVV
ncbi:Piso0_003049 [Millerozyma farinosa CBS 7064]|uniref:Piso0_003049 protein n=1 Tax=Pichia sorbitophila (strain ATCC MYA-4447 / BCRC 22081 / CBS 7064 / NBRC 10061 / NRRL Y-12695) TaxID=559304 RepID=G8YH19_PICSO|nr:Piso0_003049 [Millerozyma farinosa CBS 7064]CCE80721.1 Piso0_003049 [Millerozyma farinosa CBS 7064]